MLHSLGSGSGAEEPGILELDFCELLVAVHLNDEYHSQDQEGGASDPRRLASATDELLGHDGGFGGGALGVDDNGRLGYVAAGLGSLAFSLETTNGMDGDGDRQISLSAGPHSGPRRRSHSFL